MNQGHKSISQLSISFFKVRGKVMLYFWDLKALFTWLKKNIYVNNIEFFILMIREQTKIDWICIENAFLNVV